MSQRRPAERVRIDAEREGQRIDNFLIGYWKGVPKSKVYQVLRKGEVRVNRGRVKAGYRLCSGDEVRLPPLAVSDVGEREGAEPPAWLLERLQAAILYEDADMLVLNKPAGIAVHGGSGIAWGVIEALKRLRPEDRNMELAHRLDRETSGCLLLAKKRNLLKVFHRNLREGLVDKRYTALVAGRWSGRDHPVRAPLWRGMRGGERRVSVDNRGKPAQTDFRVRRRWADFSLVEALPRTGRTHQIRVHASFSGYPIAGDDKYGETLANDKARALGLNRLFLHARAIRLQAGESGALEFEAPLDERLSAILERLDAG